MPKDAIAGMLRADGPLRVAVDVDGTLANEFSVILANYNAKRRKEWERGDQSTPFREYVEADNNVWNFLGIGSNYHDMMVEYYTPAWKHQYRDIPFMGDAEQMKRVAEHYRLEILTSRSPDDSGITGGTVGPLKEWLKMHGVDSIPLVVSPTSVNKADLGYDIYIDDAPNVAEEIARRGKKVLLIDKPYNRNLKDSENLIRVKDVKEAMQLLLDAVAIKEAAREKVRSS